MTTNSEGTALRFVPKSSNAQDIINNLDESRASWPSHTRRDHNENQQLLHQKECPACFSGDNVLWTATITMSVGDTSINEYWIPKLPNPASWVTCELCSYAGVFSEWGPHSELSDPEETYFEVGEEVCCMRRDTGHGKRMVYSLWSFRAKRGSDYITRWCVQKPPLFSDVKTFKHARQLAKTLKMRYVSTDLHHRDRVKTKESVVHDALKTL